MILMFSFLGKSLHLYPDVCWLSVAWCDHGSWKMVVSWSYWAVFPQNKQLYNSLYKEKHQEKGHLLGKEVLWIVCPVLTEAQGPGSMAWEAGRLLAVGWWTVNGQWLDSDLSHLNPTHSIGWTSHILCKSRRVKRENPVGLHVLLSPNKLLSLLLWRR